MGHLAAITRKGVRAFPQLGAVVNLSDLYRGLHSRIITGGCQNPTSLVGSVWYLKVVSIEVTKMSYVVMLPNGNLFNQRSCRDAPIIRLARYKIHRLKPLGQAALFRASLVVPRIGRWQLRAPTCRDAPRTRPSLQRNDGRLRSSSQARKRNGGSSTKNPPLKWLFLAVSLTWTSWFCFARCEGAGGLCWLAKAS